MRSIGFDRSPVLPNGVHHPRRNEQVMEGRLEVFSVLRFAGPLLAGFTLVVSPPGARAATPYVDVTGDAPVVVMQEVGFEEPAPAAGDDAFPAGLGRILAKAVTFETLSSTGEAALFLAFYGGSGVSGPPIFAISLTTATAVYVGHELAWEWLAPGSTETDDPQVLATKAASYRVASTLRSFAVNNLVGGVEIARSAAFAASVAVADTALYVANDIAFSWWGQTGRDRASVTDTLWQTAGGEP